MSTIRVVLADDHALARRAVRSLLAEAADIEVVGEAEDGDDLQSGWPRASFRRTAFRGSFSERTRWNSGATG
jgi:hypothetical protein